MTRDKNKVVKLPSGAELKVSPAPFQEAKALYQSILAEVKGLQLDAKQEIDANFFKDIFCVVLSSENIEARLWKCIERCLYNGEKITFDTFEPVENRDDYFEVMLEVAEENILPFTKSLYAKYEDLFNRVLREAQT